MAMLAQDKRSNRCELDSHSDTTCAGDNCLVIEYTGDQVNVMPFSDTYKPMKNVPVGTVATAYDRSDGTVIVLVFHQALCFGEKLKGTLICPNQLRDNGIVIDECPTQFDPTSNHAIHIPIANITLPLELDGVISYFTTRMPTWDEYHNCESYSMTSDATWKPYDSWYAEQEQIAQEARLINRSVSALQACGDVMDEYDDSGMDVKELSNVAGLEMDGRSEAFEDFDLRVVSMAYRLPMKDVISCYGTDGNSNRTAVIAAITHHKSTSLTNPERLAAMWGIGLAAAQTTLDVTTQSGVRYATDPIHRRLKTKQAHLRYPSINTTVYSDTMFASLKGVGGDKCAQVFTTDFDYVRFYPMKKKSEAGHKLATLITTVGIMRKLVTDGAPELQGGVWGSVVSDFHIQQSITEPYSSWQNRAEIAIKRLKRGIRYHTKRKDSPKRVWNYCGMWVADIMRHTAVTTPEHSGRTPEEIMTGNTPDIGQYLMFDWYDTVEYHVGHGQDSDLPVARSRLGKWVGASHNVGQSLCF